MNKYLLAWVVLCCILARRFAFGACHAIHGERWFYDLRFMLYIMVVVADMD